MRGAAVVVGTWPVTVVRRRAAGAGVAVAADAVVPSALGCSGAAAFWTCEAANALMPVKVVRVIPVTIARKTYVERKRALGFFVGVVIGVGDHAGPAGA